MIVSRPWLIQKNLEEIARMEAEAVRITGHPGHRCFEMADGQLWTIRNEQPASSPIAHVMFVLPLAREDAEDFYGWTGKADELTATQRAVVQALGRAAEVARSVASQPGPSGPSLPTSLPAEPRDGGSA